MTDKVQKILSKIATRKLCTMDEHMAFYNDAAKEDYRFLSEIEEFIHSMQEGHANLWKPADGEDLPEYEREVVVFTQDFPNDAGIMRIAIAHRPDPKGWDGKSIATGKIEHYTPKTYGKSGWNIPDVVMWLDIELPKEIEL